MLIKLLCVLINSVFVSLLPERIFIHSVSRVYICNVLYKLSVVLCLFVFSFLLILILRFLTRKQRPNDMQETRP